MSRPSGFFGGIPLLLRAGLAVAAITGLALLTMLASMLIAETAADDAAAINQAGSLRMQSYRMLSLVRQDTRSESLDEAMARFERTLNDTTIRNALPREHRTLVRHYQHIREHWTTRLRILLEQGGPDLDREVAHFVADLDILVAGIQQEAETRIRTLRRIQIIALVLTLALALVTLYSLRHRVVLPLRSLMDSAEQARQGNLGIRVAHTGADEIGRLGRTFNTMAAHLQQLYGGLERQVAEQTRDLQRSNEALKLLYDTARTPEDAEDAALQDIVQRLAAILGDRPVTLCLAQPGARRAYRSCNSSPAGPPGFCSAPECDDCLRQAPGPRRSGAESMVMTIPLANGNHRYGVLLIQYSIGAEPEDWQLRLAEAVAEQLSATLARAGEARQQRRLALMEERAVIARELHDSLAQSLTCMKMQVSRMQTLQRQGKGRAVLEPVLSELREGLNEAYRHLRELLSTFRLRMNEPGLALALEATVEEFSRRSNLRIHLDMQGMHTPLEANTEIHLLQIAREALANIVHHAEASEASVVLTETEDRALVLIVDDNGSGLPERFEKSHHYGTRIMRERAASLGGTFSIGPRPAGGTRVRVRLPRRAQPSQVAAA